MQSGGRTELRGPSSLLDATAYTQTAGTLLVETAAAGAGRVDASGAAALAGNLAVETRAGFTPAPGRDLPLPRRGSGDRAPSARSLEVTPGIDYAVDYDATGATLRVAGATPIVTEAAGAPRRRQPPVHASRAGRPRAGQARRCLGAEREPRLLRGHVHDVVAQGRSPRPGGSRGEIPRAARLHLPWLRGGRGLLGRPAATSASAWPEGPSGG